MRIGIPFLLENAGIGAAVNLAQVLAVDFLELNTNFPPCRPENIDPAELCAANQAGLSFTLHLDDQINVTDFNPFVRRAYLETCLQAIDLAKITNMSVINIHMAKGNLVTLPDRKCYLNQSYQEEYRRNLMDFRTAVEKAIGDFPLKFSIENTDGWADYEREGIELLLQSPVFALCFDIGHDHAVKNQDLDFILRHKDRLCHMHVHDGKGKMNHQALGTGEIPLADRLTLAKNAGASVVIETKTIDALTSSFAWLDQWGYRT